LIAMLRLYWAKNTGKVVQAWKARIITIDNNTRTSTITSIE